MFCYWKRWIIKKDELDGCIAFRWNFLFIKSAEILKILLKVLHAYKCKTSTGKCCEKNRVINFATCNKIKRLINNISISNFISSTCSSFINRESLIFFPYSSILRAPTSASWWLLKCILLLHNPHINQTCFTAHCI